MCVGRLHAPGPDPLDAGGDGGVGRAPAHQQELGVARLVVDLEERDVLGDAGDLVLAQVDHALVVDPVVGHVAAAVGLLEAADAVLEAGQSRGGPGAGQGLRIADVGPERLGPVLVDVVRRRGEVRLDGGEGVEVGQPPRLGPVGQVAVGEHDDRRAVLDGQADGLDGDGEAVARGLGGDDRAAAPRRGARTWRGGGRPARSWSGSPVEGPPRCTSTITRGSSRLMASPMVSDLRSSPGPLVVVTPSDPPKAAPERGADAGDLVLGLEGADAELLAPAQLVEDVGGRGDRVAAQEERAARPGGPP